jgi:hypothetical protein
MVVILDLSRVGRSKGLIGAAGNTGLRKEIYVVDTNSYSPIPIFSG